MIADDEELTFDLRLGYGLEPASLSYDTFRFFISKVRSEGGPVHIQVRRLFDDGTFGAASSIVVSPVNPTYLLQAGGSVDPDFLEVLAKLDGGYLLTLKCARGAPLEAQVTERINESLGAIHDVVVNGTTVTVIVFNHGSHRTTFSVSLECSGSPPVRARSTTIDPQVEAAVPFSLDVPPLGGCWAELRNTNGRLLGWMQWPL
jgi:hypothetical protein